jgi:AcrR family transcriptional regulator
MRAATMDEIAATARRLLVEQGPDAMSLRAIAREMGMTAPGLYRYYSSREELFKHVVAMIFRELSADIHRAMHEAADAPGPLGPDNLPACEADPGKQRRIALKLVAALREFRRWALNHKDEFTLIFGVPLPGLDAEKIDIAEKCALEFASTFYVLFVELWRVAPFPVPDPDEIDPALRADLGKLRAALGGETPDGATLIYLRCWVLLYGAVSMEVFNHLRFAISDPGPMFEYTLTDMARLVGIEYPFR